MATADAWWAYDQRQRLFGSRVDTHLRSSRYGLDRPPDLSVSEETSGMNEFRRRRVSYEGAPTRRRRPRTTPSRVLRPTRGNSTIRRKPRVRHLSSWTTNTTPDLRSTRLHGRLMETIRSSRRYPVSLTAFSRLVRPSMLFRVQTPQRRVYRRYLLS